jgi:hypothetical protein
MPRFDLLTEQQHRHLVHIVAGLRECIADEVAYDREPEFPPRDAETRWRVSTLLYQQLTDLMREVHAVEAAKIEGQLEASGVAAAWEADI